MTDRRRIFSAALAFGFLSLLVVPLAAQQTGTIEGTVRAADAAALGGATITVQGTNLGALTGPDGSFTIRDVPAGTHTVRAQFLGYQTGSQTVDVPAGGTATVSFTLQLDPLSMQELVVTGTATRTEKLRSTFAITTVNEQEIEQKAPQSTANLLQAIPGFHVEASGGVGGNNVFPRGIPAAGSFRFVQLHEDGLPVFESPELPFLNVDQLHRIDQTVSTMEAVRGGTAGIFAGSAPGGLINFVSKTGGEELSGVAKLTVGDYNLLRADFDYGGPLAGSDEWRFNVGGFYRFDTGVRDPGFPANRGGQIKANLTKLFEDGFFRVRGKIMDDRNIFFLPIPLQNPEDPEEIPGFDANFGTMTTINAGRVKVPTPDGQTLEHNLRDGVHTQLQQVGGRLELGLGDGWTLDDNFRFTNGNVDFNAVFSLFSPQDAVDFAQTRVDSLGGSGFRYTFANTGAPVANVSSLNGNGLVMNEGWWNVQVEYAQFLNDLQITKDFPEVGNSLTFGFYFADYSTDEFWNFNDILLEARGNQPRLLDLQVTGVPGVGTVDITDNGFTQYGDFYRNAANNGRVFAGYVQDRWEVTDRWTVDGGLRFESHRLDGNTEVLGAFDLGDPTTVADNAFTWGTGRFVPYAHTYEEVAVSGGVNYDITPDRLAVFGRATTGYRIPDFDQFNGQTSGDPIAPAEVEDIVQFEGGLKFGSPRFGAFVTGFFSELSDNPFTDEVIDPATGQTVRLDVLQDAQTIGAEIELVAEPVDGAQLDVNATLQRPEITNVRFLGGIEPPAGVEFDGNQVRRIPEIMIQATPSYEVQIPGPQSLEIWGTVFFEDRRFEDFANRGILEAYGKFDAGADIGIAENVQLQLRGYNLTNTIGVTEGNPRTSQIIGGQENIFMGRPILGRSGQASIVYTF